MNDLDEEAWLVDAISDELDAHDPPAYSDPMGMHEIVRSYDIPHPGSSSNRLSHPVIIPQRRPRDRSRGFARAYAPALADHGIDQETFLRFIKDFYLASKVSCWTIEPLAAMNKYAKVKRPIQCLRR